MGALPPKSVLRLHGKGGMSPQRLQSPAPWPASKGHDADFSKSFQGDAGRPGRRGPPGEDGAKGSKASAPEGPCCPAPATHQQCPLDPPKWEAVGTAHALSRPPASLSLCQTKGGRACRSGPGHPAWLSCYLSAGVSRQQRSPRKFRRERSQRRARAPGTQRRGCEFTSLRPLKPRVQSTSSPAACPALLAVPCSGPLSPRGPQCLHDPIAAEEGFSHPPARHSVPMRWPSVPTLPSWQGTSEGSI